MSPIQTVDELEDRLSSPGEALVRTMAELEGDIIVLGAAGKIGLSVCRMALRASEAARRSRRIIAVSRFSKPEHEAVFQRYGVETLRCDLLDPAALNALPQLPNVLYLAGMKFGTSGQPAHTWAINTHLPGLVCEAFRKSRIVALSTGNVYGLSPVSKGGSVETDVCEPVGEYAASCLGRERIFEYYSERYEIPMAIVRLFYACDLRYGVLVDIARNVLQGKPIDLTIGSVNTIWQGDSNEIILRSFQRAASPPYVVNLTGCDLLRVKTVAEEFGHCFGTAPKFVGQEGEVALLGSTAQMRKDFGLPCMPASELLQQVAQWVKSGGNHLDKPTHFDVSNGRF